MASSTNSDASSSEDELMNNGYPFRDDIINFYIRYKGKKHYFEFPVLLDRCFLLREIKFQTKVRGTFCLHWIEKTHERTKGPPNKTKGSPNKAKRETKSEESKKANKKENQSEIYLHSTNLTTLSLKRFCGQTLNIIPDGPGYHCGDSGWHHFSQDPVESKKKFIEEKFRPIDCPP